MPTYTIQKGYFQVSLDEHPDETGFTYSPFHVAGFVHLNCLEREIPLMKLMFEYNIDIRPDLRSFPLEERNPMSLDRDGDDTLGPFFWVWVDRGLAQRKEHGQFPCDQGSYLSRLLTEVHIDNEIPSKRSLREQRNCIDLSKTQGDLHKYQAAKQEKAAKRARRVLEYDGHDEDEEDDEDSNRNY